MSAELARFSLGSCWLLMTLNFFSADTKPRTKEWYFFHLSRLHAHFGCWFASSLCNEQQGGLQGKKRVLKVVLHKKRMQIQCLWRAVHVSVARLAFLGRMLEEIQPHKHNIVPKHVTLHLRESAGAQNNLGVNKAFGVRRILGWGFFSLFKNDVVLNNSRTEKESKVLGKERKAQPGKGGVRVMEKEEEQEWCFRLF